MPNLDGTGPTGKGPKTGKQMGKCSSTKSQNEPLGNQNQSKRLGRGKGIGKLMQGLGKRFKQFNNKS